MFLRDNPRNNWNGTLLACGLAACVALALPIRHTGAQQVPEPVERTPEQLVADWQAMSQRGLELRNQGSYSEARDLMLKALEVARKLQRTSPTVYASTLVNLADLDERLADFRSAKARLQEAAATFAKIDGGQNPGHAAVLSMSASLYEDLGDYAAAEPFYRQAAKLYQTLNLPDYAPAIHSLAILYLRMGDYEKAEPLFNEALKICAQTIGEGPEYAQGLDSLAGMYADMGRLADALRVYLRAMAIWKTLGEPAHPDYALCLYNLGNCYKRMGDLAEAEKCYRRSVEMWKSVHLENHPLYAAGLRGLGALYEAKGDDVKAEAYYRASLQLNKALLGTAHPSYAKILADLGRLAAASANFDRALALLKEAWEIDVRGRNQMLQFGSERQQVAYLSHVFTGRHRPLSLVVEHMLSDPAARRFAAEVVLAEKGATQEALLRRRGLGLAGNDPAAVEAYQHWQQAGTDLLNSTRAPSAGRRLADFKDQYEAADKELAKVSARFSTQQQTASADLDKVAAAIPKGSALVEYAKYCSVNFNARKDQDAWVEWRYAAIVIAGNQPAGQINVSLVQLGNADPIEQAVARWRNAAAPSAIGPGSGEPREIRLAGNELAKLIWNPIEANLGNVHRVYLSPDAALSFIPFAALPAKPDGKFLIEEGYDLAYVGTGRDLIATYAVSSERSLVVGDPAFGEPGPAVPVPGRIPTSSPAGGLGAIASRSREGMAWFTRLEHTRTEATAVAHLLNTDVHKPCILLLGSGATKQAVMGARHPSILHLATHGFFLPAGQDDALRQAETEADAGPRRGVGKIMQSSADPTVPDAAVAKWWRLLQKGGPLQRSGIALAGANDTLAGRRPADGNDGILTAAEVMGMDLWGTKLVTISACESGLGDVQGSEGMYGLRRALALAGAQNLVISLAPVDDLTTQQLMVAMYREIALGKTPQIALLNAQRNYVRQKRSAGVYPHPFHWAAFVASGTGTGLQP
jgi:tetratricopeptide (TPR) repeat protein